MPTRGPNGPNSGGPEDPSRKSAYEKMKNFTGSAGEYALLKKIAAAEEYDRQKQFRESGGQGWANPNYWNRYDNFQETSQTDIPPLVPPPRRFKGTSPSNRIRPINQPTPNNPSSPPQNPGGSPPTPPSDPPSDLHLYRGKPEQLADIAEKAAIASRAAAYRRANRYSGKVLEQAKGLYDQLKGSGFESVGKQAVIAASNAFQASENARRESRASRNIHKVARLTGNPDDVLRAQQQTMIADKARDLHEQASNFSARFFRDIAQKGLESVNKSINANGINGNSNWYNNWINKQFNNNGPNRNGPNSPPPNSPPNNPPNPGSGGSGSRSNRWGKARRRLRKTRQRRVARANLIAQRAAAQSTKKSLAVGQARRRLRKTRRMRAKRHASALARNANKVAQAKKIQQIKTIMKIGLGASIAQSAASGDVTGAARKIAWASGNPVAIIGTELALAANTAAKALSHFSEQTFETNKYLANYSGTLAYAYGTFTAHEYGRKFQYAAGTSESGRNLVESMDKMRDQWMRYNIASGNIANTISSLWTRFSGGFGEPLGKEVSVFSEAIRSLSGMKIGGMTTGDMASAAGSAASESAISSLWSLAGGPVVGAGLRASLAWMFPPRETPALRDGPMVEFLKDMRDRKDRDIGPTLRGMERPIWKRAGDRR